MPNRQLVLQLDEHKIFVSLSDTISLNLVASVAYGHKLVTGSRTLYIYNFCVDIIIFFLSLLTITFLLFCLVQNMKATCQKRSTSHNIWNQTLELIMPHKDAQCFVLIKLSIWANFTVFVSFHTRIYIHVPYTWD